MHLISIIVSL